MQTAIVVGGGPAGLATAAQLKRRGLDAVILERGDALAARWRTRYQGLRLNTWRAFSRLPGKRLPRSTGRYPTREALIAYLERYARDNQLVIRLGVEAQRIERDRDGGWLVVCRDGPVRACNVVVATGWDAEPHLPAWTS
jgi:putative flavoprotein involved in K+ transport